MERNPNDWFEDLDDLDDVPRWAYWSMLLVVVIFWGLIGYWWLS